MDMLSTMLFFKWVLVAAGLPTTALGRVTQSLQQDSVHPSLCDLAVYLYLGVHFYLSCVSGAVYGLCLCAYILQMFTF